MNLLQRCESNSNSVISGQSFYKKAKINMNNDLTYLSKRYSF